MTIEVVGSFEGRRILFDYKYRGKPVEKQCVDHRAILDSINKLNQDMDKGYITNLRIREVF